MILGVGDDHVAVVVDGAVGGYAVVGKRDAAFPLRTGRSAVEPHHAVVPRVGHIEVRRELRASVVGRLVPDANAFGKLELTRAGSGTAVHPLSYRGRPGPLPVRDLSVGV